MQNESSIKIRVLIADDSFFVRTYLGELLRTSGAIEVIGLASSGTEAVTMSQELKPDVIIMDYHMPGKNGIEATADIMRGGHPLPAVIMCSAFSGEDGARVRDVLLATGAHIIEKPSGEVSLDIEKIAPSITKKIEEVGWAQVRMRQVVALRGNAVGNIGYSPSEDKRSVPVGVVVIGASTGGPPLVEHLVCALAVYPNISVVVIQHMSAYFSALFAERLSRISPFDVHEAHDGDTISPDEVIVVPGGSALVPTILPGVFNVEMNRAGQHEVEIDNTMIAIAQHYRGSIVGVLLSGMGEDGAVGLRVIQEAGGLALAQDPDTAPVRSMPQHAIDKGGAVVARIEDIPRHIIEHFQKRTVSRVT